MGIFDFLEKRRQRKEAERAQKERLKALLAAFVSEGNRVGGETGLGRHADARHAWRRAVVLKKLAEREIERLRAQGGWDDPGPDSLLMPGLWMPEQYTVLQVLAGREYYAHAPETLYGRRRLEMSPLQASRIEKRELERLRLIRSGLSPEQAADEAGEGGGRVRSGGGCVYLAAEGKRAVYVGQTTHDPERRWIQHREQGTGPFKHGEVYPTWQVVAAQLPPGRVDAVESYFIGYYNTFKHGMNDTPGNDSAAYQRGVADRQQGEPPKP